jgi:iron(III) transport system permease protein
VIVLLAFSAAVAALIPLGYLLLRVGEGFDSAISEIFRGRTLEIALNTAALVLSVSATALLIGTLQAWLTVRARLRFAGFFALVATLPLAIPSYVSALSWQALFPGLAGFWPSWLVLTLATSPYVFLAVSAALVRVDGASEEVARSLGLNRFAVFRRVTWPAIRPAATASTLLVALYTISEFGAVSILRFDTFTRSIYNAYRSSFDRTAAAALALTLVVVTLLILFGERKARGEVANQNAQATKRLRVNLGSWKIPSYSLMSFIALISVGLPITSLTFAINLGSSEFELEKWFEAFSTSLLVALASGLLISVFALAVAVLVVRYKSHFAKFVEYGVWTTHALPGVVVGLSLVFVGANLLPGLYQTIWLLLFAYLVLFLPNALSAISTPIAQVPSDLDSVAASLGKSETKILSQVVLPIAMPGILAGAALASLTVLKELPANLLLRPNELDTLATRLWQATEISAYSAAAPYALTLVVLAGLPALALNLQVRKALAEVGS